MQKTYYRHADGELREAPARNAAGKIEQRYYETTNYAGDRIFERVASIRVRTLNTVGGARPGCLFIKRANRRARKAGYPTHAAMLAAFTQLAAGDESRLRRLLDSA